MRLLCRLGFLAIILVFTLSVFGQSTKTEVTYIEVFDPLNVFGGGPFGQIIDMGQMTCPAKPPEIPGTLCPTGSLVHARGAVLESVVQASDPLVTGIMRVTGNSNLDAQYSGRAWGTFVITLADGSTWEGTWNGVRFLASGGGWTTQLQGVAVGSGPSLEGMQLKITETIFGPTPLPVAYIGSGEARILKTPSR